MKDKIVVTITDVNGSRNYLLSQVLKRIFIYVVAVLLLIFVLGGLYMGYLQDETNVLRETKEELISSSKNLNIEYENIKQKLSTKEEELMAIEDKISFLEEQIGLNDDSNITTIDDRLEQIKLTVEQQNIIFSMIPNGKVIEDGGITAAFGWRIHPVLGHKHLHQGIDLRAPIGTPVYAPADGVVQVAGFNVVGGYGYLVVLEHNFGFKTRFAHLSRKDVVKEGQFVKKGELIGYSGNTGISTGPHLHYEIRFVQRPLDPINFINWSRKNYEEIFEKEKRVTWQSLVKAVANLTLKQP
ncbi:peptidoglycan DD-metalloendopeptidase family protein [Campylobacter sp. CLAX-7218-21]|uniref:M23 family metallopeptidase n=1 Tax=Campylobacter devanensis TaxID=3161138 RepID=UPI002EC916DF|nr:peptidoglycan DD-metalloendopeptidase family protein [Campylobacter sp. CLAX-7218-21]